MMREIKGTQRLPRFLAFRVTGTGTAAINEGTTDAALTDNGTGDYTLTWSKPFARTPVVVALAVTAGIQIKLHAVSSSAAQIKTFAVDGTTATDAVFHAMVLGWDSPDFN